MFHRCSLYSLLWSIMSIRHILLTFVHWCNLYIHMLPAYLCCLMYKAWQLIYYTVLHTSSKSHWELHEFTMQALPHTLCEDIWPTSIILALLLSITSYYRVFTSNLWFFGAIHFNMIALTYIGPFSKTSYSTLVWPLRVPLGFTVSVTWTLFIIIYWYVLHTWSDISLVDTHLKQTHYLKSLYSMFHWFMIACFLSVGEFHDCV